MAKIIVIFSGLQNFSILGFWDCRRPTLELSDGSCVRINEMALREWFFFERIEPSLFPANISGTRDMLRSCFPFNELIPPSQLSVAWLSC